MLGMERLYAIASAEGESSTAHTKRGATQAVDAYILKRLGSETWYTVSLGQSCTTLIPKCLPDAETLAAKTSQGMGEGV